MNFWQNLKKPFFVLAPMADVTDAAFRRIVAKYGKPDVLWTEFVSADGLDSQGQEALKVDLMYTEAERPIVAQLFSSNPDKMYRAVKLCVELGFDGIDINMGCPDRSIEKQGSGAAMIKTPEVAIAIINSAKQAIADSGKDVPLSVKTRVGYNRNEIDTWIPLLLNQKLAVLSVHARTRKDLSKVPANWSYIKQVVEMRNKIAPNTLIIGNGDVLSVEHGRQLATQTGCDGIMIGRAIFGNPWLFNQGVKTSSSFGNWFYKLISKIFNKKDKYWLRNKSNVSINHKLDVLIEHSYLFEKLLGEHKNFAVMKKHFKAYANGFRGAKDLRISLMDRGNSAVEVEQIIKDFEKTL